MNNIIRQARLEMDGNEKACGNSSIFTLLLFLEEQLGAVMNADTDNYRQELVNLAGLVLFMIRKYDEQ